MSRLLTRLRLNLTVIKRIFLIVALAFVARVIASDFQQVRRLELAPGWLAGAFLFAAIGWLSSGLGWLVLFDAPTDRRGLLHAYAVGQLGKYAPGGVLQAAGQVGFGARSAGTSAGGVAVAFTSSMATAVVGSALVASAGLVWHRTTWLVWLPLVALAGLVGIHPRVLTVLLARSPARLRLREARVPDYRSMLTSVGFGAGSLLMAGAAFVMAGRTLGVDLTVGAVPDFAAAWVTGVLALPVPAGLGVREAVLTDLLPGIAASAIVTISILHRVTTIVTELLLAFVSSRLASAGRQTPS